MRNSNLSEFSRALHCSLGSCCSRNCPHILLSCDDSSPCLMTNSAWSPLYNLARGANNTEVFIWFSELSGSPHAHCIPGSTCTKSFQASVSPHGTLVSCQPLSSHCPSLIGLETPGCVRACWNWACPACCGNWNPISCSIWSMYSGQVLGHQRTTHRFNIAFL